MQTHSRNVQTFQVKLKAAATSSCAASSREAMH